MTLMMITVLCLLELVNLYWTIFVAGGKETIHLAQLISWGILSTIMWAWLSSYFMALEVHEKNEKENKPAICKK
ncbi:MAG: hypothetical protein GY853_01395 [PVC group bacterium]|nr:hypothetical protein [PVC group bacterium]